MNSLSLKTGIIYGAVGLLLYVAAYLIMWKIDIGLYLNPLVTYPIAIALFVLAVLAQVTTRKNMGGYISFGDAIVVFVIVVAIALLGSMITNYLIFNVFDPAAKVELIELAIQESLEMITKMGKMLGMEKEMEQGVNEDVLRITMEQQDMMGIGSLIFSFLSNLAVFSIGGLIAAAIIKRDQPIQFD